KEKYKIVSVENGLGGGSTSKVTVTPKVAAASTAQNANVGCVPGGGTFFIRSAIHHEFGYTTGQSSKIVPITPVEHSILENVWVKGAGPGKQQYETGVKFKYTRDCEAIKPRSENCAAA